MSRSCSGQFRQGTDIACVKLGYLNRLIPLKHIKLTDLLLQISVYIVDDIICLQNAGIHLDQGILTDEGIHDGLPDIGTLCLGEIIVCMVDLAGLHIDAGTGTVIRAGEILDNVIQQGIYALAEHIGAHGHRNHAAVAYIDSKGRSDLSLGEGLSAKIPLHHLFTGLCNCFHQSVTADLKVRFVIFRHLARHNILALPAVTFLTDDIDITDKLLILTDGQIERSHLLAIRSCHILYDLSEGRIVNIHIGNIDDSGQFVFLTKLPGLDGADFDACFTVDYDNCRTGCTDCLLNLTYKVKISGCINDIDLVTVPLNRNNGGIDGKLALLLFLAVIADGISIGNLTHSGCHSGQISHCLNQAGLSASAVSEQYHITNFVSCVNFHSFSLQLNCNIGNFTNY